MTPREKAIQLTRQMYESGSKDSCEVYRENSANRCALIAVEEMIDQCEDANFGGFSLYWENVKQELLNLQNNV